MVSLKDISNAAGVSVATVSKALHDAKDIGEETRERIKKIASEMGYLPNAAARSLKTKQSNNIGVLYKEDTGYGFMHEYFAGVLEGFKHEAEALGYDITFINTNENSMSFLEHCRYRNFDGVVIVCAIFDDAQAQELMGSEIPIVTIDYVHDNCSSVCSDNSKGMADLVDYAISKGYKKIAFIHGQEYSSVTKDRVEAFCDRMKHNGLAVPKEYLCQAEYRKVELVAEHTKNLISMENRPDCIIYPDDAALLGGISMIHQNGLKIPGDIGIAGYDGSIIAGLVSPAPATIAQDTIRIGKEAADVLVADIKSRIESGASQKSHILIPSKLVPGESL